MAGKAALRLRSLAKTLKKRPKMRIQTHSGRSEYTHGQPTGQASVARKTEVFASERDFTAGAITA
jgi:hypothetical protein